MSAEHVQRAPVPNGLRLGPRARRLIRSVARVVNPLVLRFAGRRHVPVLGILTTGAAGPAGSTPPRWASGPPPRAVS